MKNRFNHVVTVQYEKCCSDRAEVSDFVNKVIDENPNIVFFRKEEIPFSAVDEPADVSILVTITGWYDYRDSNSSSKKKQSKEKSDMKE